MAAVSPSATQAIKTAIRPYCSISVWMVSVIADQAGGGPQEPAPYRPTSIRLRTVDHQADHVERRGACDVEVVPLRAAEADIGDHFGHLDLADQRTVRRITMHAVGGAGPDVAFLVQP